MPGCAVEVASFASTITRSRSAPVSGSQQKSASPPRASLDVWLGAGKRLAAFKDGCPEGRSKSGRRRGRRRIRPLPAGDPGKPLALHVVTCRAVDGGGGKRLGDDRQGAQAPTALLENHREVDPFQADPRRRVLRRSVPANRGPPPVARGRRRGRRFWARTTLKRAGVGHEAQNLLPEHVLFLGEAEIHSVSAQYPVFSMDARWPIRLVGANPCGRPSDMRDARTTGRGKARPPTASGHAS